MYPGVWKVIKQYFTAYGGLQTILLSPYFHVSIVLSILSYKFWNDALLYNLIITVIPSILGFTIAAFTILFGIYGTTTFKVLVTPEKGESVTLWKVVSSTFAHFIIVQIVTLIIAILANAHPFRGLLQLMPSLNECYFAATFLYAMRMVSGIALTVLFYYALTLALATTLSMFRLTAWLELEPRDPNKKTGS
jgi:hypothetical protein